MTVAAGFERVGETFAALLEPDPLGAAVAVYVDGELVVDLYGGVADRRTGRAWAADTLAITFSCSKALLASCAVRAAQDGLLDLDAPVAACWPEFGVAGKECVTTRMILSHTAGLPALDRRFTLSQVFEQQPVLRALEEQRPLWPPGTAHAYHAMTYGWLVAEILRRATGVPLAEHFRRLTDGPGADTWLGIPRTEAGRVAGAEWDPDRSVLSFPEDSPATPVRPRSMTRAVTLGDAFSAELVGPGSGFNDPSVLAAGVPAVGVVSTARSLARIWSRTVVDTDGLPALLTPRTIADATRPIADGPGWRSAPPPHARWATGYMLRSGLAPMLSESSFGHDGAGGQLCFADPEARVGFAYVTNLLRNRADDRAARLVAAVRDAIRRGTR